MVLNPLFTAVRRLSFLTPLLVQGVVLYLLFTDRAAPAAVVALFGIAWLAILLAMSDARTLRVTRRVGELEADLAVAYMDPVTGLALRRVAERHLTDAAGTDVTVALVDVDDMHGVNDAHTHHGGDCFLATVAQRLTHAAEPGDLVARLGGDEFVVITTQHPHALGRVLAAATEQPVTIGQTTLPMHVSIGICRVPGGDPHTALGRADLAMFTAKRRRSGIEHYDPARDGVPHPHGVRPPVRQRDRRPASRSTGGA